MLKNAFQTRKLDCAKIEADFAKKKIEADLTQLQKMNGKKEMLGEGGIKLHR